MSHHCNDPITNPFQLTINNTINNFLAPPDPITAPPQPTVNVSGRGRHIFSLDANGIRDWALLTRDRKPDQILTLGFEDRIGILGAKRVHLSGSTGRIRIRDHRRRVIGIIRDPDITLAQAQQLVVSLPQGWPL